MIASRRKGEEGGKVERRERVKKRFRDGKREGRREGCTVVGGYSTA